MQLDVFIDLTSSDGRPVVRPPAAWTDAEHLGAVEGHVTVVGDATDEQLGGALPPQWRRLTSESVIAELNVAMDAAGSRGRPLLILMGPIDLGVEALGVLYQALERDPMFGFAIPRVSCVERCCIARLTRNGIGASEWLPRTLLGDVPDHELLLETFSRCVLIAPQITGNFAFDTAFDSLAAALLEGMAAARRCGFRTVVCHRAMVSLGVSCDAVPVPPVDDLAPPDAARLSRAVPDLTKSWDETRAGATTRFEQLYAARPRAAARRSEPSLLIDIRNVAPIHNGTTHAILGLVSALRETSDGWTVSLLANPAGAAFHDLTERFGDWPVHTAPPDSAFTIAFRPSQPWHLQELIDLHNLSLLTAYLLLDTIAWDVAYCAPPRLEPVWQFMAQHADGLLYDSEFTRQRFLTRFPAGAAVPGEVVHFSFDPADYAKSGTDAAPTDGHILIVGNHLDHKDVRQTARILATAFPYRRIEVLGPSDVVSPLVSAHPSGALAAAAVQRLYADAACVVYPSFYEGFGFPMLTALAHGRPVFVRRSALVEELAPLSRGSGRLITFERREDLVDLIGRMTDRETLEGLAIAAPHLAPRGWHEVGKETSRFLSALVEDRTPTRWRERERAVAQLLAYRA